eukprot:CAMPEP_0177663356 /NCGR_PEP_ID=MMETSP0447-20121125/19866_1 /TAXON_ID=0 /ORGANISM="Stygamoeba regulata, Strain BSH-02190019" /LENGTH=304 /DNA_ID=CAMNT_0019169155 /DNA_START=379 /DNA_END=1293 /DNA_ORIENTATION=+
MALEAAEEMEDACTWVVRVCGRVFVAFALGLIVSGASILFVDLLPTFSATQALFAVPPSLFLVFGALHNYLAAVFTSPGYPPSDYHITESQLNDMHQRRKRGQPVRDRVCRSCCIIKPPRAHHCKICNRCVLAMDHHCPWVGNCVGYRNHRYFLLFLIHVTLLCLLGACLSFNTFWEAANLQNDFSFGYSGRGGAIYVFLLSASISFGVGLLCIWQLYLVLTGQTTIEFYSNSDLQETAERIGSTFVNQYDLGAARNFEHFFGFAWTNLRWFIPMCGQTTGDGLSFPTTTYQPSAVTSSTTLLV